MHFFVVVLSCISLTIKYILVMAYLSLSPFQLGVYHDDICEACMVDISISLLRERIAIFYFLNH
jgi:hypothetical protein